MADEIGHTMIGRAPSSAFTMASLAYQTMALSQKLTDYWIEDFQPGVVWEDERLFHRNGKDDQEVVEKNNNRPRIGPGFYEDRIWELADAVNDPFLLRLVRSMPMTTLMQGRHNPEAWRKWARQQPGWEEAMSNRRRKRQYVKRSSNDKDVRKLVNRAVKQGATVEGGGKHLSLVGANGAKAAIPSTPSDHHTAANMERQLIRAGIFDPEQEGRKVPTAAPLVKWPQQDLDRLKNVLLEMGYDRDQWKGRRGRGPGGLRRFALYAIKVCEAEGIRVWDSANAGSKAVAQAIDKGRTTDWTHNALMHGVAAMEDELTAPPPEIEEVGPAHGDVPKVECPECGEKFIDKGALGSHRYYKHNEAGTSRKAKAVAEAKRQELAEINAQVADELAEEAKEVEERKERPLPMRVITGTPIPVSANGHKPLTGNALHLRVLMALMGLQPVDADEAMQIAAEIANLELGLR